MKNIIKNMAFVLAFATTLSSCNRDKVDPTITPFEITDNDLVQITNSSPFITVNVAASDDQGLDNVEVTATKEGATEPVAKNKVANMIANEVGRFSVNLPFPLPSEAPSGMYTIAYKATDKKGKSTSKSYKVNVVNNRFVLPCNFGSPALPAGKNVWIFLTVEAPMAANDKIYITGAAAGGWSGGGENEWAFEKVGDKCYRLAANLTNNPFKITRGNWDREAVDFQGNVPGNSEYKGETKLEFTIYNWKDKQPYTIFNLPEELPKEVIKTGMTTVVIDVNSSDDSKPYYIFKKGTTPSASHKAFRVVGTKKVALAVPRESAEYVVARDLATNLGVNGFSVEKSFMLNGVTNPVQGSVEGFKDAIAPITELYVTGDGVPSNWTNSPPVAQKFTSLGNGKFEIASILLGADKDIKFLPQFGAWNPQVGRATVSADRLTGTVKKVNEADTFKTPLVGGNYKIEIDFGNASYKLTKLP